MMAFAILVYADSSPGATPEKLASALALKAEAAQRSHESHGHERGVQAKLRPVRTGHLPRWLAREARKGLTSEILTLVAGLHRSFALGATCGKPAFVGPRSGDQRAAACGARLLR